MNHDIGRILFAAAPLLVAFLVSSVLNALWPKPVADFAARTPKRKADEAKVDEAVDSSTDIAVDNAALKTLSREQVRKAERETIENEALAADPTAGFDMPEDFQLSEYTSRPAAE